MKTIKNTMVALLLAFLCLLTTVSAVGPAFLNLDQNYVVVQGQTLTILLEATTPFNHFEYAPATFGSITSSTTNPTEYQWTTPATQRGGYTIEFSAYGPAGRTTEQVTIEVIENDADYSPQAYVFSQLSATFVELRDTIYETEDELTDACNAYQAAGDAGDTAAVTNNERVLDNLHSDFDELGIDLGDLQQDINDLINELEALPSAVNRNIVLTNTNTLTRTVDNLWTNIQHGAEQAVDLCNINFNPYLTTTSLSNAQEGAVYSVTFTANDLDSDAVTFDFTGSVLPAGLLVHPLTGVISGTPQTGTAGSYNIRVRPVDSHGNSGTTVILPLTVTVLPVPGAALPVITTTSLQSAVEGVGYTATITAQDADAGDTIHFIFTGVLPAGLSTDAATGIISGAPNANAEGTYTIVITPVDNHDNAGSAVSFTLVVNDQSALLPQYQQLFSDYEDLLNEYEDDLVDINDDIIEECDNYKAAVKRNDDNAADDAEEELDDLDDEDLEPFEDDVKTLENNVRSLRTAVRNIPSSNTQSDLEDDIDNLLDDITALQDNIDASSDDIDNFCPNTATQAAQSTSTPASTVVQTAAQTQPVQRAKEVVSMMTTPAFNQQQVPVQTPVVEEKQGLSVLTLFILSMVGLVLFLALLAFVFIMMR